MKGSVAIIVGIVSGAVFVAGWMIDPGAQTTMVTALVCGIAAVLGQMSTRDLISRSQALVERGIDDVYTDGGELLAQARLARDRLDRLAMTVLVGGVLAPFLATLRTIYPQPIWAALAFAAAAFSVTLAGFLFAANRELSRLLEADRMRRVKAKQVRDASVARGDVIPSQATDPNLMGYRVASAARALDPR